MTRTSTPESMSAKRYQTACATPMPRLTGPAIRRRACAGCDQPNFSRADAALHAPRRALVDLVAQLERVHPELLRKLIDRLLEREAALRMAGRAERGRRAGVDEDVGSPR